MKKIISLDLSINSTGFAVFDEDGTLEEWGIITPERYKGHSVDRYPKKTIKFMKSVVAQLVNKIQDIQQNQGIDSIVIEEVNLQGIGSMVGNKGLCGLHFLLLNYFESMELLDLVDFYPTSYWRNKIGLRFSEEEKLHNRKNPKNKVTYKDLAMRYVLNTYNLEVGSDEADAICVGETFFRQ